MELLISVDVIRQCDLLHFICLQVAIKYISKGRTPETLKVEGHGRLLLEVALMTLVSSAPACPNVLQLLEWFDHRRRFTMILERPVPCQDLQSFCEENGHLDESLAKKVLLQVISALKHCKSRGVLHRNIKPENLLISTESHDIKLLDFGCGDLLKDSAYKYFAGWFDLTTVICLSTFDDCLDESPVRSSCHTILPTPSPTHVPQHRRPVLAQRLNHGITIQASATFSSVFLCMRPLLRPSHRETDHSRTPPGASSSVIIPCRSTKVDLLDLYASLQAGELPNSTPASRPPGTGRSVPYSRSK
ncbi:uncharacterized protein LOC127154400 [Labeo rohita]|uniref:uncharacterized protein LOC127154400 n=1 Tax=Labeo rohita TaxID=84645 RepID=UPI0021E32E8B|nr:uncharacterized protein LOC127154400 [Labeo rohita]